MLWFSFWMTAMKAGDTQARWIHEIGKIEELCVYWRQGAPCKGYEGHHAGRAPEALGTSSDVSWSFTDPRWPTRCMYCSIPVPTEEIKRGDIQLSRHISTTRIYNTPSGQPETGDIYWVEHRPGYCDWDNCDGRHLHAVLPDGEHWDCMWRASNCTLKEEKLHRCWVVHILPGNIAHVDKAGHTCGAGAGSFASKWHGFLHNGIWEKC